MIIPTILKLVITSGVEAEVVSVFAMTYTYSTNNIDYDDNDTAGDFYNDKAKFDLNGFASNSALCHIIHL